MKKNTEALNAYLTRLFEEKGYPGMSVCVRGPEGIIFEKSFGYRNIEKKQPVDGDTIFGIASMSKSLTALACCILQVEGKMSLDDPVVKYFPDFHIPGAADECVTVKSLALHRAGIPPMEPLEWSIAMNSIERDTKWYRTMCETSPNKMDRIEQIVDYITAGNYEPLGAPGEYMSYSNEGYALLSYIVDQAAGISLEEFLMERLFKPLGMSRTILDLDCSQAKELAEGNITSLFERDDDGNLIWDDNWSVLPPFRGCACVKSTSRDITKYYQMLSNGGVYEGKRVIPAEAVELMIGAEFPLREKPYYCMGLWKSRMDGKMIAEHSGGLHGVSTQGGMVEGGYGVAVLCNEGDLGMDAFMWPCYNFILGLPLETKHYWAYPSGKDFSMPEAICGDFLCKEGMPAHTIVTVENGKLIADYAGMKVDLLHCKENVFAVTLPGKPESRVNTFRFYIRNGKAWAVKCGSRIYQRV
ncbi:MAG: beta-lactamase family protein [Firmicutes bacterium]|nr:beta-lactamase family protein [Bacillota bacterium]